MSHFTKLSKAQISNVDAFIQACADLGFTEVKRNCKIKDYVGKEIEVDVAVNCGRYDIALQMNKETGKYDMVADWWGIRGVLQAGKNPDIKTDSDLQDYLLRHTTKHTIVNKYRRQGFRAEITEDEKYNLNITLSRAE